MAAPVRDPDRAVGGRLHVLQDHERLARGQREPRAGDRALRVDPRERARAPFDGPQRAVGSGRHHVAERLLELAARDVARRVGTVDGEPAQEPRLAVRPERGAAQTQCSLDRGDAEAVVRRRAADRVVGSRAPRSSPAHEAIDPHPRTAVRPRDERAELGAQAHAPDLHRRRGLRAQAKATADAPAANMAT